MMESSVMQKFPFFQVFIGDWLKDPQLSMCTPQTRGVWFDLLCRMRELGTGEVTGTVEQLAQLGRCNVAQMHETIHELTVTRTANVTVHNKKVTISNRRLARQLKSRESNKLRQRKFRSNGSVTGKYRSQLIFQISEEKRDKVPASGNEKQNQKIGGRPSCEATRLEETAPRKRDASLPFFSNEYIQELQSRKAYEAIAVREVAEKMIAWCEARKLKPTRRRLVGWLNSEERIGGVSDASDKAKIERVVEKLVRDSELVEEARGSSGPERR